MAEGQPIIAPPSAGTAAVAPVATKAKPSGRGFKPRTYLSVLLFVGPALLLITVLVIYPTIKTIYLSFYTQTGIGYNAPQVFTGWDNYRGIFQNDQIFTALKNNILWLVIVTPVTVVLGVLFAVLFDRVRYESVPKSIVFIPMAISAVASGVIWRLMYADDPNTGTFNAILSAFHHSPISFLGDTSFVNFALMGAQTWMGLGFAVVVLSAALKSIPADLTEAARIDGANELQIFSRITVPLMWPTITVIITLTMIGVLKIFDLVYTMTAGGPAGASDVLALEMYTQAFKNANPGIGSAIAVLLLIAVIPVMALNVRRFQSEGNR